MLMANKIKDLWLNVGWCNAFSLNSSYNSQADERRIDQREFFGLICIATSWNSFHYKNNICRLYYLKCKWLRLTT